MKPEGLGAPVADVDPSAFETSLYRSVRAVGERAELERLGIAFYDGETTIQWSYNGDALFHAASTM